MSVQKCEAFENMAPMGLDEMQHYIPPTGILPMRIRGLGQNGDSDFARWNYPVRIRNDRLMFVLPVQIADKLGEIGAEVVTEPRSIIEWQNEFAADYWIRDFHLLDYFGYAKLPLDEAEQMACMQGNNSRALAMAFQRLHTALSEKHGIKLTVPQAFARRWEQAQEVAAGEDLIIDMEGVHCIFENAYDHQWVIGTPSLNPLFNYTHFMQRQAGEIDRDDPQMLKQRGWTLRVFRDEAGNMTSFTVIPFVGDNIKDTSWSVRRQVIPVLDYDENIRKAWEIMPEMREEVENDIKRNWKYSHAENGVQLSYRQEEIQISHTDSGVDPRGLTFRLGIQGTEFRVKVIQNKPPEDHPAYVWYKAIAPILEKLRGHDSENNQKVRELLRSIRKVTVNYGLREREANDDLRVEIQSKTVRLRDELGKIFGTVDESMLADLFSLLEENNLLPKKS